LAKKDDENIRWVDIKSIPLLESKQQEKKVPKVYSLLVDIFAISLLIYFYVISWFIPVELPPYFSSINPNFYWIIKFLMPLILYFPWFIIVYANKLRTTRASFIFIEATSRLSPMYRLFYILNLVFFIILIGIPVTSPILAIFSFLYLFPNMLGDRVQKSKLVKSLLVIIELCVLPISIIIAYRFYLVILQDWIYFLPNIWFSLLPMIYNISLSIASVAALGDFLYLIYQGAHEYDPSVEIPETKILLLQSIILVFFIIGSVFWSPAFNNIMVLVLFFSLITSLIRRIKGLARSKASDWEKLSWTIFGIFIVIGTLKYMSIIFPQIAFFGFYIDTRLIPIFSAVSIYLILLIYSFYIAGKKELL